MPGEDIRAQKKIVKYVYRKTHLFTSDCSIAEARFGEGLKPEKGSQKPSE